MKVTLSFTTKSGTGTYLGALPADPDTTSWGVAQAGTTWFNTTDKKFKGWNGEEIVLMG